jgi:hypothetical protein
VKVTHKRPTGKELSKLVKDNGSDEIAPSLFLHHLSGELPGIEGGKPFEAHVKGHCRGHECRDEGGKMTHSYDLDIHDIEPKKGEAKQKPSTRDQVDEAAKKHGLGEPKKEEKADKK